MGKVTKKDVLGSLEGFSGEEKAFIEKNADVMCGIINKAMDGTVSSSDVESQFTTLKADLAKSAKENADLTKKLDEVEGVVKNLASALEKAKSAGFTNEHVTKFNDAFDAMMKSGKMKDFIDGVTKSTGNFGGFSLKSIKDVASLENSVNADGYLSRQSYQLVNPFTAPKFSVRDAIKVLPADPTKPNFTYPVITEFDRNAQYETENGRLKQSNLKVEEKMVKPTRLGSYFDLSRDFLMSALNLRTWILSMVPGIVTQTENAGILFGDGTKNTLLGIANTPGVMSIEEQINGTIVEGKAGDVKEVSMNNRGVIVEFNTPLSKALDSMMITFTGAAVNTDLNTAHPLVKINDRQVIVLGVDYKGNETAVADMTFVVNNCAFKSIEDPNSRDAVRVMFACLSFAQYAPNAIMLNPQTLAIMEGEKDALGRELEIVQRVNGIKYVAGVPVIEVGTMPVGYYLAGDFQNAAILWDYTSLEMNFVEDAELAIMNMIRFYFQEQLGLVVTMPWAFAYGSLEALKNAIAADVASGISLEAETTVKNA